MDQFDYQTINLQQVRAQMLQCSRALWPAMQHQAEHVAVEREELIAVYHLLHALHDSMEEGLHTLESLLEGAPDAVLFSESVKPAAQAEVEEASDHPPISIERLTVREHEVLEMLARGYSYAEAAELLNCKLTTIQTHTKRIYRKLRVHSCSEAVFEARQLGLVI